MIRRDGGGVDSVAHAGDGAADDELRQRGRVSLRGHLDDDAEDHDAAAHHHGPSAAEEVAKGEDEDGAEQTSDLVDGGHETLHCGVVLGGGEEVVECRGSDDTGLLTFLDQNSRTEILRKRHTMTP